MYFPYLRGKQFELLALRELATLLAEKKDKISPIIEPVKLGSPTLKSTLAALGKCDVNFTLIANPAVGELTRVSEYSVVSDLFRSVTSGIQNFQIGVLIDPLSTKNIEKVKDFSEGMVGDFNGFSFIHNEIFSEIEAVQESFSRVAETKFNIVNLESTNRRYERKFKGTPTVLLFDNFLNLERNVDYAGRGESAFSDEHLYVYEEGFVGFGDYLTIGKPYIEGGFMPYAVAIHLSYSTADRQIRVQHFVSDDNGDTTDVANKFAQANRKLVKWCDTTGYNSIAVEEFRKLDASAHFPGLGIAKKLSIMNHIELVLRLI